jgi:large subunit ribosomal protein L24
MSEKVQMKRKLKTGDMVRVIAGKFKGQDAKIAGVRTDSNRVLLDGIHYAQDLKRGQGFVKKMFPVHISNVMILDPKLNVPTKVGFKVVDGKKVRYAKKSGEVIADGSRE